MPAHKSSDPLKTLALRLPQSLVEELRATSEAQNVSLSDLLRARLSDREVKPLGIPTPRRRPPKKRGTVSGDPELIRSLSKIGNNLNQLARSANIAGKTGQPFEALEILSELHLIRQQIMELMETKK
jgi:hypothetical protein